MRLVRHAPLLILAFLIGLVAGCGSSERKPVFATEGRILFDGKPIPHALVTLHSLDPFPWSAEEIAATAAEIKDPSYRVQISPDGLHIYNRDGLRTATDPFKLFPHLGLEHDGSHAFYLGVELARAQIAWQLGKRYVQDSELDWGVAQLRASSDAAAQFIASPRVENSKAEP